METHIYNIVIAVITALWSLVAIKFLKAHWLRLKVNRGDNFAELEIGEKGKYADETNQS